MAYRRRFPVALALLAAGVWWACPVIGSPPEYTAERAAMVDNLRKLGIRGERLLAAMKKVPRHLFIAEAQRSRAYEDVELPSGAGHYCCRPYVVALSIQLLDPKPDSKILQVGAECGYCTAILCELTPQVHVIDNSRKALDYAQRRVREAGELRGLWKNGKGCAGWREHGPYDAILVTCSAQQVPEELVKQLRDGGSMIIPVGLGMERTLLHVKKRGKAQGSDPTESGPAITVTTVLTNIHSRPMACQASCP